MSNTPISPIHSFRNLLIASLALVASASSAVIAEQVAQPLQQASISSGGLERSYEFYVPQGIEKASAYIIGLHGAGGDSNRFRYLTGGQLEKRADQENWIVIYPNGYQGNWNDCRAPRTNRAKQEAVDDVRFLESVLSTAQKQYGLADTFLVGFSNGGHMAYRMLAESAIETRAIALLGAHVPDPLESVCKPVARSANALVASGTQDPVNPYAGGIVALNGTQIGKVLSARDSAIHFTNKHAPTIPIVRELHGGQVRLERWVGTSNEVALYSLIGDGHVIAGVPATYPAFVGPQIVTFPIMDAVADFFASASGKR